VVYSFPPDVLTFPWEAAYLKAVLETDDARLPDRISSAMLAITSRIDLLNMDHGGTPEERAAIADTLIGLEKLRIERLGERRLP